MLPVFDQWSRRKAAVPTAVTAAMIQTITPIRLIMYFHDVAVEFRQKALRGTQQPATRFIVWLRKSALPPDPKPGS